MPLPAVRDDGAVQMRMGSRIETVAAMPHVGFRERCREPPFEELDAETTRGRRFDW